MKNLILLLLVLLASCCFAVEEINYDSMWQVQRRDEIPCEQESPSCEKCLKLESCSWCGNKICTVTNECPSTLRQSSCPNYRRELELSLEQQLEKVKDSYQEKPIILDVPQVTLNATDLCHLKTRDCSACTTLEYCAWCAEKKACIPYSGKLTANECGSKQWFRGQCTVSGALYFKPCPLRTSGCSECLADRTCYWCDGTNSCGYYRGSGFEPKNCTNSHWYHESCQKALYSKPCTLRTSGCRECLADRTCYWCDETKSCGNYRGDEEPKNCTKGRWYHERCLEAQYSKPCPLRSSSCKECLADKKCYWCDETKTCGYYGGDAFEPKNCTKGRWYYKDCYQLHAIIVLLPILLIIFTPIVAYLVMYCIFCLMKEAGYNALEDSDSSDDEDKTRKPIMLRHDTPDGKTDKLRRKYNLDKNAPY